MLVSPLSFVMEYGTSLGSSSRTEFRLLDMGIYRSYFDGAILFGKAKARDPRQDFGAIAP